MTSALSTVYLASVAASALPYVAAAGETLYAAGEVAAGVAVGAAELAVDASVGAAQLAGNLGGLLTGRLEVVTNAATGERTVVEGTGEGRIADPLNGLDAP